MKELNALRHKLATLGRQGLKAKLELDKFLEMDVHDRRTDIARLLKAATSPQLAQLSRAFDEDLLVREKCVGRGDEDAPRGCLVFHLFGFRSNSELRQRMRSAAVLGKVVHFFVALRARIRSFWLRKPGNRDGRSSLLWTSPAFTVTRTKPPNVPSPPKDCCPCRKTSRCFCV